MEPQLSCVKDSTTNIVCAMYLGHLYHSAHAYQTGWLKKVGCGGFNKVQK